MNNIIILKQSLEIAVAIIVTLGILFSLAGSARAKVIRLASGRNIQARLSQATGPSDPAGLESFLDDEFGKEMKENHFIGVTTGASPPACLPRL